jgi:hypothetical protein
MSSADRSTQDLAALYRDIFETDARGAAILEDLHARFGVVKVHTDGGIDAVLKTYKSAAKAEIVGYILNRIAQANGDRPINPQDQEDPPA